MRDQARRDAGAFTPGGTNMTLSNVTKVALVAIGLALAGGSPASAEDNNVFMLRVKNETNAAVGDDGRRLQLSVYRYDDGKRGRLLETKTIDPGDWKKHEVRIENCSKTKRRAFVVRSLNASGDVGPEVVSGVIRMKMTGLCYYWELEYTSFTDVGGDPFEVIKRKIGGMRQFEVLVGCTKPGACEV